MIKTRPETTGKIRTGRENERKFALICDIMYLSFASLIGPLSAFRFISPTRVMITAVFTGMAYGQKEGGYYLSIFARCIARPDIGNAKSDRTSSV